MEQQYSVTPTAPARIRSEVVVTVSCALLATLVVVCSGRRTSTSAAFRYAAFLALMLCYPAVSYIIGLTQPGNGLAVVWACYLVGCADGVFARGVDEPHSAVLIQATQVMYVLLLLLSYMTCMEPRLQILVVPLWALSCAKLGMRVWSWSTLSAGRHRALAADNWLISKYMAHEHVRSVWDFDPETMKGYRYVVAGEKQDVQDVCAGYRLELTDELVTVDRVWHHEGSASELKDLCLSFALFKLLRRRLGHGPVLHERDDVRSTVLVRRGLAGGDCERMYRVIEVELGFLLDSLWRPKESLVAQTAVFVSAVALSLSALFSPALRARGSHNSTTLDDILITRCAVVAFVIMELFQYMAALSRLLSDGHKVRMLCRCVGKPSSSWQVLVYERLLRLMMTLRRPRYWSNSVGQYSLVHDCLQKGRSFYFLRKARTRTRTVPVPVTVKRAIHLLLRSEWLSDLKYGDRTLQRNKLLFDFDWSTSRYPHGAVGSILVWHIATTICGAKLSAVACSRSSEVATTLSDYCAYLLSEAPELVTDEAYETQRLMAALRARIQQFLRHQGCRSDDDAFDKLPEFRARERERQREREEGGYEEDILADGIKLSLQISEEMPDEATRWDVLSEVWVELLLSAAPSENVEAHVKKLATGGQLITQLWALLTHAGIVDKPKKPKYSE